MANILYISYDGLLEPLGQSQVLQYVKQLAQTYQHDMTVVSYEKPHDWQDQSRRVNLQQQIREAGITWVPLRYHKAPSVLATSYDLAVGIVVCGYWAIRKRVHIVHARSYVASIIALVLKKGLKKRFIFDMRGFWADEKLDSQCWQRQSRIYRLAKWFEKRFLLQADCVVSLTHSGIEEIKKFTYMHDRPFFYRVIPTCTNLELFKPAHPVVESSHRNPEHALTIGYVGTSSGWYLFEPVLQCYQLLLQLYPHTQFLIINRQEHQALAAQLNAAGIPPEQVRIIAAEYTEVPRYMAEMDATLFFIKPAFSKRASAPTKLGEFLACGIPCLTNAGVGDVEQILGAAQGVGVVLTEFTAKSQQQAVNALLALIQDPLTRHRCVAVAHQYFALEQGVQAYHEVYQQLTRASDSVALT